MDPSFEDVLRWYEAHLNPGLARVLRFMGFEGIEVRAEGPFVWDHQGRRYIDCLGGFGTFALGHRHPKVLEAVRAQLERMPLSSRLLFNEPQARLAARLAEVLPGRLQYCFFCNSGAEAVEGALKLARLATGREEFLAAENAFHGKTLGALSVSGREVYRAPFAPLLPRVRHVPFGDASALAEALSERTAAVILEPIQGEGGVIVPPQGYLKEVERLCRRVGALLILDEVQTGLGRTGRMFAAEHEGVEPDILCLAKALGGGVMPLGCFAATPELWARFTENPLLHSSTFGGNPLACAAGLATLEVLQEERLPEQAAAKGESLLTRLRHLQEAHPGLIREVRGRGLLVGLEFAQEDIGELVIAGLAQRGILAAYTLNNPRVIRLEPPLNIPWEVLEEVLQALDEALAQTEGLLAWLR